MASTAHGILFPYPGIFCLVAVIKATARTFDDLGVMTGTLERRRVEFAACAERLALGPGRTERRLLRGWQALLLFFFLGLQTLRADPAEDFTFTSTASAVTITGYIGAGGAVSVPDSINGLPVRTIQGSAFKGKTTLTGITLPDSVASIGDSAFESCTGLVEITIGAGVTSIGFFSFDSCFSLESFSVSAANPNYSAVDGVLFDKVQTALLKYPPQKAGAYDIPAGVKFIAATAFFRCSKLTGVTIPPSVISLGSYSFHACTGLSEISIIPSGTTNIGTGAFYKCSGLTSVILGEGVSQIGNEAFLNCKALTGIVIPDSVTGIGNAAFAFFTSLGSILIGDGVTSIGKSAFSGCSGLTGITIPGNVSSIGDSAFMDCTGLSSVMIPGNVTSVGNRAFSRCTGLIHLTLEHGIASIGLRAFSGCTSLTRAAREIRWPSGAFEKEGNNADPAMRLAKEKGAEEAKNVCRKCRCECPTVTVRSYLVGFDERFQTNQFIGNFTNRDWRRYFADVKINCTEVSDRF